MVFLFKVVSCCCHENRPEIVEFLQQFSYVDKISQHKV